MREGHFSRFELRAITLVVALLALSACSSAPPGAGTQSPTRSQSPSSKIPSPGVPQSAPQLRSNTGNPAYDFGYNIALDFDIASPWECSDVAFGELGEVQQESAEETEFLLIYQGCFDASVDRAPNSAGVRDLPPGGVPYEDPCLSGDIDPWVIIFDGPTGPGDFSVGAPCQEVAEEYALSQLPPGTVIIESFRV